MFIHLLERCPELEELRLPASGNPNGTADIMERVAEALDSNCQRLHTLNHSTYLNTKQIGLLLKGSPRDSEKYA